MREKTSDMWAAMHQDDPRLDPRANVFLMAVLCTPKGSGPVRVRNLSSHGALLEGPKLPEERATVLLKRGTLIAGGEVAWSKDQHCGIRFECPIRVEEWIERAGPVGQQRIDAAVAEFRKGPTVPTNLAVFESAEAPPETLARMIAQLLQVCERMAGLPDMSIPLAEELLKIEAAARRIEVLAARPR